MILYKRNGIPKTWKASNIDGNHLPFLVEFQNMITNRDGAEGIKARNIPKLYHQNKNKASKKQKNESNS